MQKMSNQFYKMKRERLKEEKKYENGENIINQVNLVNDLCNYGKS